METIAHLEEFFLQAKLSLYQLAQKILNANCEI
jgi:hypothetical protein